MSDMIRVNYLATARPCVCFLSVGVFEIVLQSPTESTGGRHLVTLPHFPGGAVLQGSRPRALPQVKHIQFGFCLFFCLSQAVLVQIGPELLQPVPPTCWNCRCVTPHTFVHTNAGVRRLENGEDLSGVGVAGSCGSSDIVAGNQT